MYEKLRFALPSLLATLLVSGFMFFVGTRIAAGEKPSVARGLIRHLTDFLNTIADRYGALVTGGATMALAIAIGIAGVVLTWREY